MTTVTGEWAREEQLRWVEQGLVRDHSELPPEVVRHEFARARDAFADARIGTFVPILVERLARRRLAGPVPAAEVVEAGVAECPDSYRAGTSLRLWGWHSASRLLADELPRRWAHTGGVARRAAEIADMFPVRDAEVLVAAAWVHDIGYADEVAATRFHQLDGARYLRAHGAPLRVCSLVAYHSGAAAVAAIWGLSGELSEFEDERGPVRDALWYCDMTTSPDGTPMSFRERMSELRARRAPDDPVIQALDTNEDERAAAVHRTEDLLNRTLTPA